MVDIVVFANNRAIHTWPATNRSSDRQSFSNSSHQLVPPYAITREATASEDRDGIAHLVRLVLIVWLVGPFPTRPPRPAVGFLEHFEQFEGVFGRPLPNLDKSALVWILVL
jgi:hypothetical protein